MRGHKKGFTLIELIMFIVIGGMFVPLAYIAFSSAIREATTPESLVRARFIAEAKVEDLTKETFANIPASSPTYTNVNTDSRYTDPLYTGYQWKWSITYTAYQDDLSHSSTTISNPPNWTANTSYKVGDYVQPITPNNHFYRFSDIRSSIPAWQSNTAYNVGNYVQPTSSRFNGHVYRCIQATGSRRSGGAQPSWPLSGQVNDGPRLIWQENTQSGGSQPTWPTGTGATVNDGGNIIVWRESYVYKQIAVYVKDPHGYEYIVNTIVTSRTAP